MMRYRGSHDSVPKRCEILSPNTTANLARPARREEGNNHDAEPTTAALARTLARLPRRCGVTFLLVPLHAYECNLTVSPLLHLT